MTPIPPSSFSTSQPTQLHFISLCENKQGNHKKAWGPICVGQLLWVCDLP